MTIKPAQYDLFLSSIQEVLSLLHYSDEYIKQLFHYLDRQQDKYIRMNMLYWYKKINNKKNSGVIS